MSKPNGAVFQAIRRDYRHLIENDKHNQDRLKNLKSQVASLEDEINRDITKRIELDNFAMQMGWTLKDLTE